MGLLRFLHYYQYDPFIPLLWPALCAFDEMFVRCLLHPMVTVGDSVHQKEAASPLQVQTFCGFTVLFISLVVSAEAFADSMDIV